MAAAYTLRQQGTGWYLIHAHYIAAGPFATEALAQAEIDRRAAAESFAALIEAATGKQVTFYSSSGGK